MAWRSSIGQLSTWFIALSSPVCVGFCRISTSTPHHVFLVPMPKGARRESPAQEGPKVGGGLFAASLGPAALWWAGVVVVHWAEPGAVRGAWGRMVGFGAHGRVLPQGWQ